METCCYLSQQRWRNESFTWPNIANSQDIRWDENSALVNVRFHMGCAAYRQTSSMDNDVDIGFEGEGRFADMTLSEFFAPFKAAGLTVQNKWTQSGTIVISKEGLWLSVDLFAFYNDKGTMRRRGLESWFFALNYRTYHSFPAWVVEPDLPQVKFGFFNISIPKGGIEIMKHLYPYNWWKEVRPEGC